MATMRLVRRYRSRGINPHLTWVYTKYGRCAGIDRNNDILNTKYRCFEGTNPGGEDCRTMWYPSLETARKVVWKYITGEIPHIPTKRC